MRDAVGFFVAADRATDSSAVYVGAGRDLGGAAFSMECWATSASLPHTDKNQCRSMCTANSMKKSSMASRDGGR